MTKTVLIPAAGAGSRFTKAGIHTPKPLIHVAGQTLLEHTLDCFPLEADDHLVIAVQRRHQVRQVLAHSLHKRFPDLNVHWVELNELLPGQLATATAAMETSRVDSSLPLWIHNCDTGFRWNESLNAINGFASMPVFEADGDHWSFGCPDPKDPTRAIAIAEKRRISNLASIGLYGFTSIEAFLKHAHVQLQQDNTVGGEHYIAPMLHQAISTGERVYLPKVDDVKIYGTPAELCLEFSISLDQLRDLNQTSAPISPSTKHCN